MMQPMKFDMNASRNSRGESNVVPPLDIPFRTLGAAFRKFADLHPHKPAIHAIDQGFSFDFAALNEEVERTARRMVVLGVTRGSRVAILSGDCIEKLILMFGAWRCGATACPFHAEISGPHLKSILEAIEPSLVIWRDEIKGEELTRELSCPEERFRQIGDRDGFFGTDPLDAALPAPGTEYSPDDEACIFATSGTTDRPKCVVWDHLGLWMCGLSTIDFTGMTGEDRLLEYRTFSWLSPQIVTFMPFVTLGLTIYVAAGFSRHRFFSWIRDHGITVAAGVPTVINILIDDPVPIDRNDTRTLRLMTASSAPLSADRWRQFESLYGIRLLQFYGASEGGWLCGNRHDQRKIGTVGPPAPYMDLAIVNPEGATCATGEEGEITIRGPQTAIATMTSEGGWEDRTPFRLTRRTRVGDLGIMDEDGFVTVSGRVKDVILRGGVSIAPLEIDAAMMTHPEIREAAAVGIPDPVWGEEIVCFVVPAADVQPDTAALLEHAARILSDTRCPKQIILVDALPRNDRGKVRRDELRRSWKPGLT